MRGAQGTVASVKQASSTVSSTPPMLASPERHITGIANIACVYRPTIYGIPTTRPIVQVRLFTQTEVQNMLNSRVNTLVPSLHVFPRTSNHDISRHAINACMLARHSPGDINAKLKSQFSYFARKKHSR
ncbi:hypothetical protein ABW21_db0202646 [Orbilia brochopaga]|nr:hypothetical protein ABW21_db0202646 [Drechslerella brochopaga]